jgi:hypothetical protein
MRKFERDNKLPQGRLAIEEIPAEEPAVPDNMDPGVANVKRKWEFYYSGTGRVLDTVDDINMMQANAVLADVQRRYDDLPADQIRMRSVPTEASAERARARNNNVQDTDIDVAQNFTEPTPWRDQLATYVNQAQPGTQEVDGTGEPIWEIYDVSSGRVMTTFSARDQQAAEDELQDQLNSWGTDDDMREVYAVRPRMQTNESRIACRVFKDFDNYFESVIDPVKKRLN